MTTIEFDEWDWDGELLHLRRKDEEVDTIFLHDLVVNWMKDMCKKHNYCYKEI